MQGRIGLFLAGAALAIGGGVAGAVVVAPEHGSAPSSVEVRQAAEKEALASLQHTFKVAKKARGMARGARGLANGLVTEVDALTTQTQQALNAANQANSRLDSTQIASDTVAGTASVTADTSYESDPASVGPTVTVTVPQSGWIEVSASVRFVTDGAVGLFEDGNLVPLPGQDGICTGGSPAPDDALIAEASGFAPVTLSTPPALGLGVCGTAGEAPGPILLKRSAGQHTYQLRYSNCGCGPTTDVSNRTLRVAPQL